MYTFFFKNVYKTRADRECEFFCTSSNELVFRKAAYGSPTAQKEKEEERTNENKREARFIRMENIASLGTAIRKYSKSKMLKEDYQLLDIKIGLFIIPGSERRRNKRAAVHGIHIKYNKDNKRTGYSLKLSVGSEPEGSPSINSFFFLIKSILE